MCYNKVAHIRVKITLGGLKMGKNEIDRQDLMKQLSDASINWNHDELMEVIAQELRKDSSVLDMVLIDTAAARLLQLQGKDLTGENLHQIEEEIMHDILRKELGLP